MTETIKSISFDQDEILGWIHDLYLPNGFDADVTYGNGVFYKNFKQPTHKFDIDPQQDGVVEASSVSLPLDDKSISSAMFDPPFLTYIKQGREHNSIMSKRFSGYWRYDELVEHYTKTIHEVSRVTKKNGIFVIKCQDIIHNHKMHCTHNSVINWATESGFRLKDLFILCAKHRIPVASVKKQQHARVYHSYFLVFEKS